MNTTYKLKINQVKVVLGLAVKLEEAKLQDGTVVSYEALEVGFPIFTVAEDGSQAPLAEGEYTFENGMTIKVDASGVIAEIMPVAEAAPAQEAETEVEVEAAEEPKPEEPVAEEPKAEVDMAAELAKVDEKVNTCMAAIEMIASEVSGLKESMSAISTKLEKFAKAPAGHKVPSVSVPNETTNTIASKVEILKNAMKQ